MLALVMRKRYRRCLVSEITRNCEDVVEADLQHFESAHQQREKAAGFREAVAGICLTANDYSADIGLAN